MDKEIKIGEYLFESLKKVGIDDVFGVPGDFALGLLEEITKSDLNYIGTCNELNAAYAADGYARVKGAGALVTTYAVGELSAINGIAGAWAENVPVIIIVGCPSTNAFKANLLLHHTLGQYDIPMKIFSYITKEVAIIDRADSALSLIDNALQKCLTFKKPVYIGICSDLVNTKVSSIKIQNATYCENVSSAGCLDEAVSEIITKIANSKKPVIIPGIDLKRCKLDCIAQNFIEKSGIPYATMLMGKTVISENHPQHLGLYCGNRSRAYVREYVESSDCVIMIGEKLTDFNTGGFTALIPKNCIINIEIDILTISHHTYHNVLMKDVLPSLTTKISHREFKIKPAFENCVHRGSLKYFPKLDEPLTMSRFFDKMATFIPENSIVIAETGASMFSACEVLMPKGVTLISQAFYGSIGYTIGACLGVCVAKPNTPVILFIGDGSFQVTCQDLSTMIRYGCSPLIFLINNDGYTIERVIKDNVYNDIQMWKYSEITKCFGEKSKSCKCKTENELEEALATINFTEELLFIELIMDKWDCNEALKKAGASMAKLNNLI